MRIPLLLLMIAATSVLAGCGGTVTWVRVETNMFDPTALVETLTPKKCGEATTSGSTEMSTAKNEGSPDQPRYVASSETVCYEDE